MFKFLPFFFLFTNITIAQDSLWNSKPDIEISGFLDSYYAYDFNTPEEKRQQFFYNHNRHNEFNINLALVQFKIEHPNYRGNLGIQFGNYAQDNYALEEGLLKNIFEAYIGIALDTKKNLWIDAGVFSSHLGFESAISSENYTLTRSFFAESSPYFLSGAKITYTPNTNLELMAVITNGWQRIKRVQGNSLPSFGTQVIYRFNDNNYFNWSTFIGTDDPDFNRRMIYFNNLYGHFSWRNWNGFMGVDFGFRSTLDNTNDYHFWGTPVVIIQYEYSKKWKSAIRGEYFYDKDEVIIATDISAFEFYENPGFSTGAFSLNLDYHPAKNLAFRNEIRYLISENAIFSKGGIPLNLTNENLFLVSSLSLKF